MKARALAAIAAAIAIVALLPAPGATARARPAGRKGNPTITGSFSVSGSHGYLLSVALTNRSALAVSALTVDGPSLVVAQAKLRVHEAPGSDRIKASLGSLGRIDMRFVPKSVREEEPLLPVCKGERDTVETGLFVGIFEYHGEHGYTRARVRRAPGSVTIAPAPACHHRSARHAPHKRAPHERGSLARQALTALAQAEGTAKVEAHGLKLTVKMVNPRVEFGASRLSGPDKHGKESAFDTFVAAASRRRGRIREESAVLDLLVQGRYFRVPDLTHLTSEAVLEPPAPFLGSATLRQESSSEASWDGDLRVNLPGFGVLPLTGPTARVTMCADSGCRAGK